MTADEVAALSDDEIRRRVAALIGVSPKRYRFYYNAGGDDGRTCCGGWESELDARREQGHLHQMGFPVADEVIEYDDPGALPDYPNDLNATHEAEKVLSEDQWNEYYRQLYLATRPARFMPRPGCDEHTKAFIHASARQRAIAFILTMQPA